MNRKKMKALYTALLLCMATTGLSACGSDNGTDNTDSAVVGRVTSVSDSEIQLEIFKKGQRENDGEGGRFHGASGAAIEPGETPPHEKPEGTPPAADETKSYTISSDTKVYQQDGEEKTEITLDDLNPGSMVSVESDGDEAESITIQNYKIERE